MRPFRSACVVAVGLVGSSPWMASAHADAFAELPRVPVAASPTCGGDVGAEAEVALVQTGDRIENGVRAVIHYDAGVYDGSCALTVTAAWTNLDTGASGSGPINAVSTIDGHYGFIGYANTTFETGRGSVVVTFSSHPGAELTITT